MKKHEAVEKLERAGQEIHGLYGSAWNTALHPTQYGWGSSLFGLVSIPVLSAASIGHALTTAVTKQLNADTFERITTLGAEPRSKGGSDPASPPNTPNSPGP